MKKMLFYGKFNWHGEIIEMHKRAFHEKHAFRLFTEEIAKRVKTTSFIVRQYFNGSVDNFKITVVIEKTKK